MSVTSQIIALAPRFKIEPELIAAIIEVESAGTSYAVRYEPKWVYLIDVLTFSKLLGITEDTERTLQMCSWGVMQVMGSVARQHGFNGYLNRLSEDYFGVYYGCTHLQWLSNSHGWKDDDLISAYNAGHPNKDSSGNYLNKKYVENVKHWLQFFKDNGVHEEGG